MTNDKSNNTESLSLKDMSDMKVSINNLVWMYAPSTITLGEADEISCNIQRMILDGKKSTEHQT